MKYIGIAITTGLRFIILGVIAKLLVKDKDKRIIDKSDSVCPNPLY
tara:strand:- start:45 stop:182 length:138 start_codon:yes stop_codon:yes gene_type:complete